jgi:glycosyltransferase involved in cell wall biosynthesis
MFPEHIGESVNPLNDNDIAAKLRNLLTHPDQYETIPAETFDTFRWNAIAKRYIVLYRALAPTGAAQGNGFLKL